MIMLTFARTVTNVVPSSMTLILHLLRDESLLSDIRRICEADVLQRIDLKALESHPLLLSMYAETLRFGVQIHIPRESPHSDLKIGTKLIPKGKMMLMNTWLAHTDEELWNTKRGTRPLDQFWPHRFLIDLKDPSSGPTKRPIEAHADIGNRDEKHGDPSFSTHGLEGAWIPFGGRFSTPAYNISLLTLSKGAIMLVRVACSRNV